VGDVLLEFVGQVLRRGAAQVRAAQQPDLAAGAPLAQQQQHPLHMLPLDGELVIDARSAGGTASFIRHSCR
jgi:SET domain-containing protein